MAHEAPGDPEADGPYRRLARAVQAYEIFPLWLVSGVLRREPVEPGDTYGICYHFLPGVDLFFGGRVTESFDGPADGVWRAGFTFRTVQGHLELGEETFFVEKDAVSRGGAGGAAVVVAAGVVADAAGGAVCPMGAGAGLSRGPGPSGADGETGAHGCRGMTAPPLFSLIPESD